MRLALRVPAQLLALTVLWIALWDEISLANALGGLVVAVVVVAVAPREEHHRRVALVHVHVLHAVGYIVLLGWKLLESNLRLAWEILTPGSGIHTGIIAVEMSCRSDDVVTLVANSITLTPGTLTVEAMRHGDDVTLYVHAMFTQDVEAVRRELLQLEARALRAFGSADEAAHAAGGLQRHDAEMERRAGEER